MMPKLTPLKAVRAKCLDCSCGSHKEVSDCLIPDCPLFPYRFGKRPVTVRKHNKNKGGDQHETTN
jgi:hypothetical protein